MPVGDYGPPLVQTHCLKSERSTKNEIAAHQCKRCQPHRIHAESLSALFLAVKPLLCSTIRLIARLILVYHLLRHLHCANAILGLYLPQRRIPTHALTASHAPCYVQTSVHDDISKREPAKYANRQRAAPVRRSCSVYQSMTRHSLNR